MLIMSNNGRAHLLRNDGAIKTTYSIKTMGTASNHDARREDYGEGDNQQKLWGVVKTGSGYASRASCFDLGLATRRLRALRGVAERPEWITCRMWANQSITIQEWE
jgi:hypothetical protein